VQSTPTPVIKSIYIRAMLKQYQSSADLSIGTRGMIWIAVTAAFSGDIPWVFNGEALYNATKPIQSSVV